MKQYPDLTPQQKERAIEQHKTIILEKFSSGVLTFEDRDLQDKVDPAIKRANDLSTPWFAAEYVNDAIGEIVQKMAEDDAADSFMFYPEPDEHVMPHIIQRGDHV